MTEHEIAAFRRRSCTGKSAVGAKHARLVAQRARAEGSPLAAYRCVFCHDWHVGHPVAWSTVEKIAELIRQRAYPKTAA